MKALAKGFEGQFECLGKYRKECIDFLVPIKEESKKNQQDNNTENKIY